VGEPLILSCGRPRVECRLFKAIWGNLSSDYLNA